MKPCKFILSLCLSCLSANAAVINRAEFVHCKYDSVNKVIRYNFVATPLSWVSFYTCSNVKDIGSIEASTFLTGWYIIDYIDEIQIHPNNIGFLWMNSTSTPVYK